MSFSISCCTSHWWKILLAYLSEKCLYFNSFFERCFCWMWNSGLMVHFLEFAFVSFYNFCFSIESHYLFCHKDYIVFKSSGHLKLVSLDCFPLILSHIFLFLYMCSNFELHPGYCGWHIVDAKDSVIFLWRVLIFVLAGSSITDWSTCVALVLGQIFGKPKVFPKFLFFFFGRAVWLAES